MRSINGKLTLAFLAIGILSAILVSWVISQRAQQEFGQFVAYSTEQSFQRQLSFLYQLNGDSWQNIEERINKRARSSQSRDHEERRNSGGPSRGNPWRNRFFGTLADVDGQILVNTGSQERSPTLTEKEFERASPIIVDNKVVGHLILSPPPNLLEGQLERFFLQRFWQSVIWGTVGGALLALLAGWWMTRTFTKPLHQLTSATQTVAQGDLGHQVDIASKDEIGQLADSFNSMSSQLANANNLRQQMTADIAHDLRTPLSVILGYTEALNDGKLSGNAGMYEVLHRQAQHLNHLIEELRTLSLADAGKLTLYKQSVAPATLLEQTKLAHQVQAESQGVTITIDNGTNLPSIEVDPDRMIQVLGNLVNNALHYTASGGKVTLRAHHMGDQLQIDVVDTGSGIHADDLPAIFERFYQADKNRSQEGASGLGLPIAKSIIEAHGGTISATSVLDTGSTFSVFVPLQTS